MKDIPGYEGLYAVTRDGKVWSHPKRWKCGPGTRSHQGKFLAQRLNATGYCVVGLYKKKSYKSFLVHRLVALAYIHNPLLKPAVNHVDGKKTNNRVENLEWCTWAENDYHARENGLNRRSPRYQH